MLTALETLDAVWLPVLLDATIKGAALLALAGLVTLCMRRTSAASRHAVWLLAMVGLLLLHTGGCNAVGRAVRSGGLAR